MIKLSQKAGVFVIILQANNLTKRFNGETLFKNINLTISEKSHIGLVGQNGAGKSTILKMLIGIEAVSEGTITKKKNLSIGYLHKILGYILINQF